MARLNLVEMHADEFEIDGRPPTQGFDQEQQSVAVLAARKGDHNAISGGNQVEVRDRSANFVQ